MFLLAVLLVCNAVGYSLPTCPVGFDLVNGQCRGLVDKNYMIWYANGASDVAKVCEKYSAYPIIIHSVEEDNYWSSLNERTGLILGITCDSNTKKWQWTDGSPVDYKPATYYHPKLDQDCTPGTWLSNFNEWYFYDYSGGRIVYIGCVIEDSKPAETFDYCTESYCYKFAGDSDNWQGAVDSCGKFGATVASIHNEKDNSFLATTAASLGFKNGLLLGAGTSGKNDIFTWVDNSAFDYSNYADGFPNARKGDCLMLSTNGNAEKWMNIECTAKLTVLCSKKL